MVRDLVGSEGWDARLVVRSVEKIHGIIFLKHSNLEISPPGMDDS